MDFDLLIAGGGLAGGLIALRVKQLRHDLRVGVVEAGATLGGNHTWSFFGSDMNSSARAWLDPLVVHRWRAYNVAFPSHSRRLKTSYQSITGSRLDEVVRRALPPGAVITGARVEALEPTQVRLADGRVLDARAVIDARGGGATDGLDLAWQKFVGLEVETEAPHGLTEPIIMDATVEQLDGYRFVYVLPFSPTRLLIEDTYYSDGPELDAAEVATRVHDYARRRGWSIALAVREERGVLPIALGGDMARFWDGPSVPRAGMRAALFHPLTGYSLPDAVRSAELVARSKRHDAESLHAALKALSLKLWRERAFYRLLNRLLFRAARPDRRYQVLERYYRLPEDTIGRLYAGRSTRADIARTFIGKPPVPLGRAIAVTMGAR